MCAVPEHSQPQLLRLQRILLLRDHYKWVCASWTPDAQGYVGLGRMYVDDPRFTASYDKNRAGLAPYLFEGIKACAAARLG